MLCNNELKLSNHYMSLYFYVPANFDFFLFNEVAVYSHTGVFADIDDFQVLQVLIVRPRLHGCIFSLTVMYS